MPLFLISTSSIALLIAGYLFWLRRSQHGHQRSRFQIRLTALFLICVLLPAVPLLFFVSTLLTQSLDVLLLPEVEKSLLSGIEAIKLQIENHAQLFHNACHQSEPTSELMESWRISHWSKWENKNSEPNAVSSLPVNSIAKNISPPEPWGEPQSQVRIEGEKVFSEVWLPRDDSLMVLIEIPLAPEVLAAKDKLSRAATVYNSLALIKEEVVRGKILWTISSAAIFLLAGIAVFAARVMSRQISGPIEQLSSAMAKAATGDLTFQAEIKARDEIASLVDAFNKMIRDLRESREKLVVSERLAAWREVARQVSHEIRNPLTPIHLALHRLRTRFEKIGGEAKVAKESFQSIDEELAALGRLAEAFSTFARLPEPKPEPTNLNELIRSTARVYENTPERIKLHLDLQENLPTKMLDRDQMRRVLTNLLKNAAEATPPSRVCEITIRTGAIDGRIKLEVIDNGAGLSAEALKKIFQPNFTTKQEGAGLGLVMVKRIIEQHGGSIEVESMEGIGTTFKILL